MIDEERSRNATDDLARMTIVEHLAELRARVLKAVIAVFIGGVICWFAYFEIFDVLIEPLCQVTGEDECRLVATDALQPFLVRMQISAYGGVALAMPVILWQVWRYITPGLYSHERRYAIPFVAIACVLFVLGAVLAFFTLPRALDFLLNIGGSDIEPFLTPDKYFGLVVRMMVAFGIGFEFPVVLVFLQLVGVLHHRTLRRFRRYAIVGIVTLCAFITPSGDPVSLFSLSVPLYAFYEISILIGWFLKR